MLEWFSPAPPRVLAHRGLCLPPAPGERGPLENSIAAFRAAWAHGVTHMETDVRATADGVAVLWHDATLEAFDGTDDRIAEVTLAELDARAVGERRIPAVGEALRALPEARFNFDVKAMAAVGPLAQAVREAGAQSRSLVCSFSTRRLAAIRRALPACPSSASSERMLGALVGVELGDDRLARRALGGVDALQIPERAAGVTLVSPPRLAAWKRLVREVHVWTVNEPTEMLRLWRAGVDGIVTDRSDLAATALAQLR